MKQAKNMLLILLTATLLTTVSAVSTDSIEQSRVDSASTGVQIEQGDLYKKGIVDRLGDFALSFSGVDNTYSPGEEVNVEITADTEQEYDTADATKVVKVYKCADSGCDDAPSISSASEDSCSSEEFWPNSDDCIARNADGVSFSVIQGPGTSWSWDTSFSGFQDESTYILQGYIYTYTSSDGWEQVTGVSEEKFEVVDSSNSDDGSDDSNDDTTTEPEPEPEPQIEPVNTPNVAVDKETGQVSGQVTLENTGGDMSENYIVEMQVRDDTGGLLSFVGNQGTCDPDQPANVHKEFNLKSGEQVTINLNTEVEPTGEDFQIRFATATGCIANGGGGSLIEPYSGGNYYTVTREIGFDDANVVSYREPEVTVDGKKVTGTVYLENTGGPMTQRDIVEMQIKTTDDNFLSFVESRTDVCDSDHPENVHKEYRLDAGNKEEISLTSEAPEAGKYDIVLLTVDQCGLGGDSNRGFVEPFKGWRDEYRVSSLEVGDVNTGTGEEGGDGGDGEGNELPVVPIAVGSALVIGGVFYLWQS